MDPAPHNFGRTLRRKTGADTRPILLRSLALHPEEHSGQGNQAGGSLQSRKELVCLTACTLADATATRVCMCMVLACTRGCRPVDGGRIGDLAAKT